MDTIKRLYPKFQNPLLLKIDRPVPKEVAIIGAGTIGPDIGYYIKSALPEIRLYLVDVVESQLNAAKARLEGYAKKAVEKRKMKEDKAKRVLENIVYTLDYNEISGCDFVIEAATENIPLKQQIFEKIEAIVSDETIITSNTSSIPADRIFNKMKRPQRATITHFFAPAWRSLPVEVIVWDKVDRDVVDYLCWFFVNTGKVPLITDNAICFMLDRVFDNWCNEAAYLLPDSTCSEIDKVAEEFVAAGPFYVLNLANGNPIIIETNTLQMEEGEHYRPAKILASVERWKTHRPGAKVEVDEAYRRKVRDRLLGILFSQSFDIIDRGIGTKADLNFGCQIALGFKKGPMDIMKELGEDEVKRVMDRFLSDRPGFPPPKEPFSYYQDFYRYILVDEMDGVKIITIRRPQALNALNDELNMEILDVLQRFEDDPQISGFIITGYGTRAFSAGADIGKFPEMLGNREASIEYSRSCAKVQMYMDKMKKPVVAAINGLALGGGLEIAIRCHSIVALKGATFQFPEITLGILPGIGGCIVPYRRWPKGAEIFHQMICLARPLSMDEALDIGMVDALADDFQDLISKAMDQIKKIRDNIPSIPDGKVDIPPVQIPDEPMAGKQPLSKEAVSIAAKTIEEGAKADTLEDALEIGYRGFGEIACTEAAKEGIGAFLEKRRPNFRK